MTIFHLPTTAVTLLLFLSSTLLLLPSVTSSIAYDADGDMVRNAGSYFLNPDMAAPDEGPITWTNTSKSQPCPLFLTRGFYDNSPFSSVTIYTPLRIPFIPLDAPVHLSFDDTTTPCKNSLDWSVKSAGSIDKLYVIAGGYEIMPPYKGYFKVMDSGTGNLYVYKLQFCVEWEGNPCLDVGLLPDDSLFVITPDAEMNLSPLHFTFSKAYTSHKKKNVRAVAI